MIDDRALVVGPQQHEAAVELDQVVVGEALDFSVRNGLTVPDHAAEVALRGDNLRHSSGNLADAPTEQARAI